MTHHWLHVYIPVLDLVRLINAYNARTYIRGYLQTWFRQPRHWPDPTLNPEMTHYLLTHYFDQCLVWFEYRFNRLRYAYPYSYILWHTKNTLDVVMTFRPSIYNRSNLSLPTLLRLLTQANTSYILRITNADYSRVSTFFESHPLLAQCIVKSDGLYVTTHDWCCYASEKLSQVHCGQCQLEL